MDIVIVKLSTRLTKVVHSSLGQAEPVVVLVLVLVIAAVQSSVLFLVEW